MKLSDRKRSFGWFLLLWLLFVPTVAQSQNQFPLQGEVAVRLALVLGLDSFSPDQAIGSLTKLGITPPGGWNSKSPASQEFISALFDSLVKALRAGTVTGPVGLPDASSLLAAAMTSSGMSSAATVQNLVAVGGGGVQAAMGAGRGTGLPTTPGLTSGGGGGLGGVLPSECPGFRQRPGGTGGGGSGCVGTQSR